MANTKAMAQEERRLLCQEATYGLLGDLAGDADSDSSGSEEVDPSFYELEQMDLWRLYVSHFLSTWNTRTYEFAAILFLAQRFPNTLLPTSVRGVLVNLSTLCLSSAIGRCIDFSSSRLRPLQVTIFLQRTSIFFACITWASIAGRTSSSKNGSTRRSDQRTGILNMDWAEVAVIVVVIIVGIVESLCSVGNNISMERDWVPAISTPTSKPSLYVLSASLKRIDLISKLVAPAFVSILQTSTASTNTVAVVLAAQNMASIAPEWFAVRAVWTNCPNLRKARSTCHETGDRLVCSPHQVAEDLRLYFGSAVWLPSLSSALQSFSVLSMSGLMTTYLMAIGYSLSLITTVRILSSLVELAPTILVPWTISLLSQDNTDPLRPLSRIGTWGLGWQTLCLIYPAVGLCYLQRLGTDPASRVLSPALAALFLLSMCLSRFGAWTHNLIAQNIVQITVPVRKRAQFSGIEMAFVSAAEITKWSCAALWPRPEQFPGLGIASFSTVAISCLLFSTWARRRNKRQSASVRLQVEED